MREACGEAASSAGIGRRASLFPRLPTPSRLRGSSLACRQRIFEQNRDYSLQQSTHFMKVLSFPVSCAYKSLEAGACAPPLSFYCCPQFSSSPFTSVVTETTLLLHHLKYLSFIYFSPAPDIIFMMFQLKYNYVKHAMYKRLLSPVHQVAPHSTFLNFCFIPLHKMRGTQKVFC